MKNVAKNSNQYKAALQNYALALSADANFMTKVGLSEKVLDLVLQLPHGAREREFVKYVLDADKNAHSYQKAA